MTWVLQLAMVNFPPIRFQCVPSWWFSTGLKEKSCFHEELGGERGAHGVPIKTPEFVLHSKSKSSSTRIKCEIGVRIREADCLSSLKKVTHPDVLSRSVRLCAHS